MPAEYVPTTEEVREAYVEGRALAHVPYATSDAEFDRWLATHDATIRAALRQEIAREIRAAGRDDQYRDYGTIEDARRAWDTAARIAEGRA